MEITVSVSQARDLKGRFEKIKTNTLDRLKQAVTQQTEELAKQVRTNIAAQFRNPIKMQAAIGTEVKKQGDKWIGTVDASGRVTGKILPYMHIQEYGGIVRTPEIFPRGRALAFTDTRGVIPGGLNKVFAAHTRAHPTKIPPRSYLRLALTQRQQAIRDAFEQAVKTAVREE